MVILRIQGRVRVIVNQFGEYGMHRSSAPTIREAEALGSSALPSGVAAAMPSTHAE